MRGDRKGKTLHTGDTGKHRGEHVRQPQRTQTVQADRKGKTLNTEDAGKHRGTSSPTAENANGAGRSQRKTLNTEDTGRHRGNHFR